MKKRYSSISILIVVISGIISLIGIYEWPPIPIPTTLIILSIMVFPGALIYMITLQIPTKKGRLILHVCSFILPVGVIVRGIDIINKGNRLAASGAEMDIIFLGAGLVGGVMIIAGVSATVSIVFAIIIYKWQAKRRAKNEEEN